MRKAKDIMSKTGKWLLVFGILFSQLSLPISVLADEMTEKETTKGEEINKEVPEEKEELQPVEETKEKLELLNENEEESTIEEGEITDPTETPSDDPINPEEPSTSDSILIEWTEDECIIKNTANTPVTLEQISKEVEDLEKILDKEENELSDLNPKIYNNFKLVRKNDEGIESSYKIIILGDHDDNGIVDENDQKEMLKKLLNQEENLVELEIVDVNEDGEFNILDITHPVFTEKTWENDKEATDELKNSMFADKGETYLGEEIKVNYYISGFQQDSLKGIEGVLNYDKELLELTKIEVNGEEKDMNELDENHFAYLLEDFQSENSLITLTFLAKKIGTANIAIEEIVASIGGKPAIIDGNKVTTSVNILEYGKGGDVEETGQEIPTETLPTPITENEEQKVEVATPTPTVVTTNKTVQYVALSTDNYIKSLTIAGYDIDFDMNKLEYTITVKNSVNSLDLNVVLNDENSSYYVEGNKDFKVGENTVNIVVKSESGSTRTYTIKVNKEKSTKETSEEKEEETNNSSKTVIIILIILVIIGLIYVIFKDDEEDQKDIKKNNKKESKK